MSRGFTFFIDENTIPDIAIPLGNVYTRHKFKTARDWSLLGVEDVHLFKDLQQRECDAIITFDSMQLQRDEERTGLRDAGLHWIGIPQIRAGGTQLVAILTAITVAGLHNVIDKWAPEPHAYQLQGPGQLHLTAPEITKL